MLFFAENELPETVKILDKLRIEKAYIWSGVVPQPSNSQSNW